MLPKSIMRRLSETEMDTYRKPFTQREARLPMLIWPRELPIKNEPTDVLAGHYTSSMFDQPPQAIDRPACMGGRPLLLARKLQCPSSCGLGRLRDGRKAQILYARWSTPQ